MAERETGRRVAESTRASPRRPVRPAARARGTRRASRHTDGRARIGPVPYPEYSLHDGALGSEVIVKGVVLLDDDDDVSELGVHGVPSRAQGLRLIHPAARIFSSGSQ